VPASRPPVVVEPESGRRGRREFLGFPYRLYRDEPRWVPPLRMGDALLMNRAKNPFFRRATAQHFFARRGGRVVGRIAAIENPAHNEFHGDRIGFFGWFDVEPDPEAAKALLDAAATWVRSRGLVGMRGPVSYSTNDTCGVLVDGFEERPVFQMPWNRPDYDDLIRGAGLVPTKDLVAYHQHADPKRLSERVTRIAKRALERAGLRVRPLDMSRWDEEVEKLEDVYNQSWERNWGFVPMSHDEFAFTAKSLRFVVDPRVFLLVEREGKPVGVFGPVPNLNEALVGLNGRLFPFGLFRLLSRRKRIRWLRVMILGVVPSARGKGVDAALLAAAFDHVSKHYDGGECGWILEDNARMRADMESIGGIVSKRFRIYDTPDVASSPRSEPLDPRPAAR
jgi:GNAT superfamily N-acetyltransferase